MKLHFAAFLVFALLSTVAAAEDSAVARDAAASQYSSIASDLPLMPGMLERTDSQVMFDKPEGRIAEVTVVTLRSRLDVLDYYQKILPSLGWKMLNPQIYRRDAEQLVFRFNADKSITFLLGPSDPFGRNPQAAPGQTQSRAAE